MSRYGGGGGNHLENVTSGRRGANITVLIMCFSPCAGAGGTPRRCIPETFAWRGDNYIH